MGVVTEGNDTATSPYNSTRNGCGVFGGIFGKRRFWRKHGRVVSAGTSKDRGSSSGISKRWRPRKTDEASILIRRQPIPISPSDQNNNVMVEMKATPPKAEADIPDGRETVYRNPNIDGNDHSSIEKKPFGETISHGNNGLNVKNKPSEHKKDSILVRASSKVTVLGNLGNIKQVSTPTYHKIQRALSRSKANPAANDAAIDAATEAICLDEKKYGYCTVVPPNNNSANKATDQNKGQTQCGETGEKVYSRVLSIRADPEKLKAAGNDEYREGRFAEALALYDQAILLAPDPAAYHCNKGAALIRLGKPLDAVSVCREAIRLDPTYARAHRRLALLYFRLGIADKSLKHYKLSGHESDPTEIQQAQTLQMRLTKCSEAKKQRDYQTLVKETSLAINAGADVAPYLFACQSEALMKLNRHDEADCLLSNGPQFVVEAVTQVFGTVSSAYFLLVGAQLDLASGRQDYLERKITFE